MENNIIDKRTKGEWVANIFMDEASIYSPTAKEGIAKMKYSTFNYSEEKVRANAEFIVKAVNNYDSLIVENEKLKRLLEDLTPGGSEFYNDPEHCAKWVKDNLHYLKTMYVNLKKKHS